MAEVEGLIDRAYIRARSVLLDALEALESHRDAVVLVGAQAIYLHTGEGDLAVAPYTTDGDLAIDPAVLAATPRLADALRRAGFAEGEQPGQWIGHGGIVVDLMVPAMLGGPGRRGARLAGHGNRAARKARGLEAALVDVAEMSLPALDESDRPSLRVRVAGPAALLVAKLHKIGERVHETGREKNKDAYDVFRLLRRIPTERLANDVVRLRRDARSSEVTHAAIDYLAALFGSESSAGVEMVVDVTGFLDDPKTVALSCAALAQELMAALESGDKRR